MVEGSYLIHGPASVKVTDGYLEVLGYRVNTGSQIVIPIGRSAPIRVSGDITVSGSRKPPPLDDSVYSYIDGIADRLSVYRRVMIVGPTDAGKSTLAAWILNKMFNRGVNAYYLATDVGQNEAFCPGFVALASVNPPVIPGYTRSFGDVRPCFIGSFTPSDAIEAYRGCIVKLADIDKPLVIDTDGWVTGEGVRVKVELAKVIGVNAIVTVGLEGELRGILESIIGTDIEIVKLPRLVSRAKSYEERKTHRERLIALKLTEAKQIKIKAENIEIGGIPFFKGKPLNMNTMKEISHALVYAEILEDGSITGVYRERKPENINGLLLPAGWEKGLLVAVECDKEIKPGILEKIDYRAKTLTIITPCKGRIEKIKIGKARVEAGSLLGRAP